MAAYLEEQLKSIEHSKINLEKEQLKIQKQLELEIEKVRILELDGTIGKLKVQVNELSEKIKGNIMPNNIHIVHHQMKKDLQKDLDEWHKLQNSGKLCKSEIETRRLFLRQREIYIRRKTKYHLKTDNEKFITLEKFKENLSKIDDETKNHFTIGDKRKLSGTDRKELIEIKPEIKIGHRKELIEIKPEIKIYYDILPIFRTLIGIITKQHE